MDTILKTNRLIFRPMHTLDFEAVHAYASDIENSQYMIYLPNKTEEETKAFLTLVTTQWQKECPSLYEFAIILNGKLIGGVSVSMNDQRTEGELGWILNKEYWGKGYATEAAMAIKDFAINELKATVLVAHCDYRNAASCRVIEKIGFTLVSDHGERQYVKTGQIARELVFSFREIR